MITNVSGFGLDTAYAPLVPYSKVPLVLAMGPVRDVPVIENGEIRVGKSLKLDMTIDHRLLDGSHAAKLADHLQQCFRDPQQSFGVIEPGP